MTQTPVVGVSGLAPRRRHDSSDVLHAPPRQRGGLVRARAFGIEETFVGREGGYLSRANAFWFAPQ
jgi:hypothetical protein